MEEQLQIKTKNANYYVDNGIFICEVNSDVILDLEMSNKLIAERKNLISSSNIPFLILVKNYLLLDKEGLNNFGSTEGLDKLSACAIVIKSPLQRMLTNFRALFSKNHRPYKVFTRTSDAKLWLFKYIIENEEDFYQTLLSPE